MKISIALFAVLCLAAFAAADKDPRSGGGPDVKREIDYDLKQHSVEIEAKSRTAGVDTRYEFVFTTDGFPRWRSRFFTRTTDSIHAYSHRVAVLKIVEYNDTGATAGSFDSADTVTHVLHVATLSNTFNRLITWTTLSADNTTIHHWNTHADGFAGTSSSLNITFHTSEAPTTDPATGQVLDPKGIKFDLDLLNYVVQTPSDSVAIALAVTARDAVGTFQNLGGNTQGATIGGSGGIYWTTTITRGTNTTTTTTNIVPSSPQAPNGTEADAGTGNDHSGSGGDHGDDDDSSEASKLIYFSTTSVGVGSPISIKWDPGFTVDTTSGAGSVAASLATIAIGALFAVFAAF